MTEYVDIMRDVTGTRTEPAEVDLLASREGRRIRRAKEQKNALSICIVFWTGSDCATMQTAKGGVNYKAVRPAPAVLADAARFRRLLELNFDAGVAFGPGRSETWMIEPEWDELVAGIRSAFMPNHVQYCDVARFWASLPKVNDDWCVSGQDPRMPVTLARVITDLVDLCMSSLYLPVDT